MLTAALFPDPKEALKEEHINHHHSSHSASNGKNETFYFYEWYLFIRFVMHSF